MTKQTETGNETVEKKKRTSTPRHRILCPTDFTGIAENAIIYAARYAQATGADLTLFHVQPLADFRTRELLHSRPNFADYSEQLKEKSRLISKHYKIKCGADVQLSRQSLSRTISNKASKYDLIIMGTGSKDLYQFLSGTNTYHVIREAEIPILIVPAACPFDVIKNVVYAFNYIKEDELPLEQLLPVLQHAVSLNVLLVTGKDADQAIISERAGALRETFTKNTSISINFSAIYGEETGKAIDEYMYHHRKDILALCTKPHGFLDPLFHTSVIKEICMMARYPVYIFHR